MLLEMQQRVVAEEAADGASRHPFHASKQGGHVVAPVAEPGRRLHATLGRHADHAGAEPGDRTSLQTVRPCGSS
jgi:hypothetical protein